jgi:hypothetical protein
VAQVGPPLALELELALLDVELVLLDVELVLLAVELAEDVDALVPVELDDAELVDVAPLEVELVPPCPHVPLTQASPVQHPPAQP